MTKKRLTTSGIDLPHGLLIILSIAALSVSLYLTNHFFEARFPDGLGAGTFCNINSFFNCDNATFSQISHLAGIPLAFLGVIFGSLLLFGSIFPSDELEDNNTLLALVNAVGCFILFVYSLLVLKSLCPFCSLYYLFSWGILFLFYKYGTLPGKIAPLYTAVSVLALIASGYFFHDTFNKKTLRLGQLSNSVVEEFKKLKVYPELPPSPYRIHSATSEFNQAPVQITLWSDFQCPACKAFSDLIPDLIKRYGSQMNIQYYPYPLDDHCNPEMKHSLHPFACMAAKIAMCAPNKFFEIHERLFIDQEKIGEAYLESLQSELGVTECVKGAEINEKVLDGIKLGKDIGLSSTPTFLINGRKIEGARPMPVMSAIFDYLIALKDQ